MARTNLLTEALLVAQGAREDAGHDTGAFGSALLQTLSNAGDFHATLAVPVYPRNAQSRDLQRIGQDFYRTMERYAKKQAAPPS